MTEDALLVFPCELPIKVIGRNDAAFRAATMRIVRSHFPGLEEDRVSEQLSRSEAYLSLTVVVAAQSREEADNLFRELTASDDILMVF